MKLGTRIYSKPSICACGFTVLNDSVPIGKAYEVDEDSVRDSHFVCGGCGKGAEGSGDPGQGFERCLPSVADRDLRNGDGALTSVLPSLCDQPIRPADLRHVGRKRSCALCKALAKARKEK